MTRKLNTVGWMMVAGVLWAGMAVAEEGARPHLLEPGSLEAIGAQADSQLAETGDAVSHAVEDARGQIKDQAAEGIQESLDVSDRIHAQQEEARGRLRGQLQSKQEELGVGLADKQEAAGQLRERSELPSAGESGCTGGQAVEEVEQAPVPGHRLHHRGR